MDNKALGKGLNALITPKAQSEKTLAAIEKIKEKIAQVSSIEIKDGVEVLMTDKISYNRFQPRQHYDDDTLEELKASIKEKGILQPLLVRPIDLGFEVVAGERRLRAAKALGLAQVPVVIKQVSDNEALILALIENIQRQDLNVIDEALAFDRLVKEFNMTQEQIAQSVGKDRATVTNTLRLLKLPASIQQQIVEERITMGHARALLTLSDEAAQLQMAQTIVQQNLSVRSVEGLVKQAAPKPFKKTKAQKLKDPDISSLEEELRGILGTKVIVEDKKGRGKLVIEYYTLDDLDRILSILRKAGH